MTNPADTRMRVSAVFFVYEIDSGYRVGYCTAQMNFLNTSLRG